MPFEKIKNRFLVTDFLMDAILFKIKLKKPVVKTSYYFDYYSIGKKLLFS